MIGLLMIMENHDWLIIKFNIVEMSLSVLSTSHKVEEIDETQTRPTNKTKGSPPKRFSLLPSPRSLSCPCRICPYRLVRSSVCSQRGFTLPAKLCRERAVDQGVTRITVERSLSTIFTVSYCLLGECESLKFDDT